ncbi:S1 family peptidase [Arthrobacter psychrolactophilus]
MRASKRAFFKRAGAACAAAAVLLAGTFTASSATAAPSSEPTTSSTSSAVATAVPTETASLPDGMAEAVKRDLNMSVEEFNAQAVIADEAAIVQAEIIKADPAAVVSVAGDTINVVTSNTAAAKAAASSTKVNVTPAAPATLVSTVVHADLDTVYADYIAAFGTKNLQSIMTNAKGEVVIRTGVAATASPSVSVRPFTAPAAPALDSFAAEYSNVVVADASGAATALAENVVSGQGYASPAGGGYVDLCSIGWNGFNKAGENAVISAGHCTNDGVLTNTWLTDPSKDNAGNPTDPGLGIGSVLGTFGFSQFGGPNNSPATGVNSPQEGNIGTDVSVIDNINPALNPIATVTDWKSPSNLGASGTKVTGVSTALVGTAICKSGRTTGWSCGTVAEVGYFMVRGLQDPTSDDDNRAVAGFGSNNLRVDHGDSGEPRPCRRQRSWHHERWQ